MIIQPIFDPILNKLRNSDSALLSLASITDPFIVNNLQVLSNGSINNLHTNTLYASTATIGNLTTNNIYNASTISTYIINTSRTDFDTSYVTNGEPVGSLYWNIDRDTLQVLTVGGEVDLGEDLMFYAVNQTGSTINKGTVVQFAGALGSSGKMLIAPAVADGSVSAIQILGITKETITNGNEGKVIMVGELRGINTSVYGTAGTILYIDPATPGGLTSTEPTAPNLRYPIAATLDSKSNGNLIIRAIFNPNLRDLNDVSVISLASGQVLMANASGVWSNQTINVALPSLGSLAVLNDLSYTSLLNLPSLGSLAVLNDLSYTSLLNLPSLGSLAVLNDLSYTSLLNLPSLGSLAILNDLSYTSLLNLPSLGSLAVQNTVDYSQITNTPSLGSLAVLNDLSYTSLLNLPSLGSLAQISNVVVPLVLSGATLSISQASIVHNNLGGLTTGDPHTQYALLNGRSGGQELSGGTNVNNVLTLRGTTASGNNATNNAIRFRVGDGINYVANIKHNGAVDMTTTTTTSADALTVTNNISGTTGDSIGAFFTVNDTGGGVKTIYGHRARINYSGATNISGVQATSNQIVVNGGGTVANAEVLTSNMDISNNSVVTDAKLIRLFAPNVTTGGSIGTLIGLSLPNLTQGTTNWSIYSEGGAMYHAGQIQGGNGSPTAPAFSFLNETSTGMYKTGTAGDYSFTSEGTRVMTISNDNRLLIAATNTATNPSARLEIAGTTGAVLLPRLTTTQRNALTAVNGMIIYNSTTATIQGYVGGAWTSL